MKPYPRSMFSVEVHRFRGLPDYCWQYDSVRNGVTGFVIYVLSWLNL